MGKILDEAIAKYGEMTDQHMADFKAAMMPFFTQHQIGENDVSVEVDNREHWVAVMFFPTNGYSESAMEKLIVPYFVGIGGDGEDQLLTLSDDRSGYFEWVAALPSCPREIREAEEAQSAADELEEQKQAEIAREEQERQLAEEAKSLGEDLKAGKYRSKTDDGYLVLAGEYYDDIESGEKICEFREISPYNLKRTIGLKTIRLQRGYGHPGQPPKKMRWTVEQVNLVDDYGEECDPFNIPDGFAPTMIAIHLGKRVD